MKKYKLHLVISRFDGSHWSVDSDIRGTCDQESAREILELADNRLQEKKNGWDLLRAELKKPEKFIGTSLQGEINVSYWKLCKVFGKPNAKNDGYKTDAEWNFDFMGDQFTIYNWKNGVNYCGDENGIPIEDIECWHIGGIDSNAPKNAQMFIDMYNRYH